MLKFPGTSDLPAPLADRNLDPVVRLEVVLRQLSRARAEFEAADLALGAAEIAAAERTRPDGRIKIARERHSAAYTRWNHLSEQGDELAREIRRSAPLTNQYESMYAEKLEELTEQFDGGPHYVLLCERVASLHARLKQIEAGARDYLPGEHVKLNQQLLAYINQLQRYTEATKSEQISAEAQGVAEKILMIVEKNLATSYPELWRGVMREVRQALESAA